MALTKSLIFTDIHFGCKNNSDEHNQLCLDFIDFMLSHVKKHNIDNIIFLGDWFENRNAINVSTLNYSYKGVDKLSSVGLPVYMLIGNHDLYTKVNRNTHSLIDYGKFDNITIIDKPVIIDELGNGTLLCPWLFHGEYSLLNSYECDIVMGHFEFSDFVVAGSNVKFKGGPVHNDYRKFKRIFSGHFHKRQAKDNILYIGNAFPTTFGDAGDFDRGCTIYDHTLDSVEFMDWKECPKYVYANISDVLEDNIQIPQNANVKFVADVSMEYNELMEFKNSISDIYQLSSIAISEPTITYSEEDVIIEDTQVISIDEAIIGMLTNIESTDICNETLVSIYNSLKLG